jgi:hypothetical protein
MMIRFEVPALAPDVIIKIKGLMGDADVEFKAGQDKEKKEWVRRKAMPLLKDVELPKIPTWLVKPIKEAAVSIIIDTLWAVERSDS